MAAGASVSNLLNPAPAPAQSPLATQLANLNTAIPGFTGLSGQASSVIGNLLNGTPSPSTTQQAAATFGNQNGLGTGSGIVNNYGYNLYNQQGQANQQQGINDLLNMLGGYAGTVTPTAAQNLSSSDTRYGIDTSAATAAAALAEQASEFTASQAQQNSQFGQTLSNQQSQFGQTFGLDQFNSMLNALGLGNSIVGSGTAIPQLTF